MPDPTNQPAQPAVPAKKKKSKRTLIVVLASLVLIAVIAAAIAKSRQKEPPIPVTVEKAAVRNLTHLVTATGKVQPEVEVKITPEVGGEITDLPFKEGQLVKKGDVLVRIKQDYYKAQVEGMEASLVGAQAIAVQSKAQLLKAGDDFKRSEDLYQKKLISDSDYTLAKTQLEVAQANYENAQAQIRSTQGSLNQVRDQLGKTTIYAPMDGTISSHSSEIGERVIGGGQFAGTEIMRVADLSNMELRVLVNENDIVNVKIGDKASVAIDAYPNRKFAGVVREISSSALTSGTATSQQQAQSTDVTNFLVKISITDRDAQLRPGMSATADIMTETVTNVVSVPLQSVTVRAEGGLTSEELRAKTNKAAENRTGSAIDPAAEREAARREREKLSHVVFVKTGNTVKMVKVDSGIADNTYIEIKSGLKAGDEVVSGTYAAISRRLKDGSAVMIDKPKPDEKK
ncbi:MAG TPA: efflux RND transporter periplasmic adaptor subunit [Lacunisphaera sp.]|nr:efflux RND transporter periplasmic adaptor subunit [Lacunisphaera sp.]